MGGKQHLQKRRALRELYDKAICSGDQYKQLQHAITWDISSPTGIQEDDFNRRFVPSLRRMDISVCMY
jgi:hypothetical protein